MPTTALFPWVDPTTDAPVGGMTIRTGFTTQVVTSRSGREQRRKLVSQPRHGFTIRWEKTENSAARTDTLYAHHVDRGGAFLPFLYFHLDAQPTWTAIAVGTATAAQTVIDLPSRNATGLTVYLNGVAKAGTFTARGGAQGRDRFVLTVAATGGENITATWTGQRLFVVRYVSDLLEYSAFEAALRSVGVELLEVPGE